MPSLKNFRTKQPIEVFPSIRLPEYQMILKSAAVKLKS